MRKRLVTIWRSLVGDRWGGSPFRPYWLHSPGDLGKNMSRLCGKNMGKIWGQRLGSLFPTLTACRLLPPALLPSFCFPSIRGHCLAPGGIPVPNPSQLFINIDSLATPCLVLPQHPDKARLTGPDGLGKSLVGAGLIWPFPKERDI